MRVRRATLVRGCRFAIPVVVMRTKVVGFGRGLSPERTGSSVQVLVLMQAAIAMQERRTTADSFLGRVTATGESCAF